MNLSMSWISFVLEAEATRLLKSRQVWQDQQTQFYLPNGEDGLAFLSITHVYEAEGVTG